MDITSGEIDKFDPRALELLSFLNEKLKGDRLSR